MENIHICSFESEPTKDHECREAIWSQGKACKKCQAKCYRAGWDKKQVDADNKKLVQAKRGNQ